MNGLAQLQAQNLASMGRGRDSMLMHVTPSEVQGLAALAQATGRTMTTNPQTGLPEAGWFEDLLPSIAALGLTAATGGAASPLMAGLKAGAIAGGVSYAQHGDLERALGQGLMSGGMSAMGAGLGGMGDVQAAAPVADATITPIADIASQQAAQAIAPPVTGLGLPQVTGAAPVGGAIPAVDLVADPSLVQGSLYTGEFTPPPAGVGAPPPMEAPVAPPAPGMMGNLQNTFGRMGAGLERITTDGDAFNQFLKLPSTRMGGIAALGGMGLVERAKMGKQMAEDEEDDERKSKGEYNRVRQSILDSYASVGRSAPWMAAEGGEVPLESGGFVVPAYAVRAAGGGDTEAGLAALSQKYGARPIRGPGTGTSDSIPARIDGKTPARVSNGEAYVPRESVKRHGGSARFYKMLEAAKRQRRGA